MGKEHSAYPHVETSSGSNGIALFTPRTRGRLIQLCYSSRKTLLWHILVWQSYIKAMDSTSLVLLLRGYATRKPLE